MSLKIVSGRAIAVIGGDMRLVHMAEKLGEAKNEVTLYQEENAGAAVIKETMKNAELVVTPIPFSRDGVHIFSKGALELTISDFLELVQERQKIFGGNIPVWVKAKIREKKAYCFDFMEMEEVALENTAATAEGAIAEAIVLSDRNIDKSRCLILGFGRCGKALAQRLAGLGGLVTVAARRKEQRLEAGISGLQMLDLEKLGEKVQEIDFIFNTIPAMVLEEKEISKMKKDSVIIDIASKPGGTDFEACKKNGIGAVLALGLPGKYSPKTSAEILVEAMERYSECETEGGCNETERR